MVPGEKRTAQLGIKDALAGAFRQLERIHEVKDLVSGLPSGVRDLDLASEGLLPGDLWILSGAPRAGKTTCALVLAMRSAVLHGVPTLVVSPRTSGVTVMRQCLATCIARPVDRPYFRTAQWKYLTRTAGLLADAPLSIDDTACPALAGLEDRARTFRLKHKGDGDLAPQVLVVVDDVELVTASGGTEPVENSLISLKRLARELEAPMVTVLRQQDPPVIPGTAARRADLICHLMPLGTADSTRRLLTVVWNRRGPTAAVALDFWGCPDILALESESEEG